MNIDDLIRALKKAKKKGLITVNVTSPDDNYDIVEVVESTATNAAFLLIKSEKYLEYGYEL
jgi:MoaA/NifB/PqqE/SkfB family radical SAM enzyme